MVCIGVGGGGVKAEEWKGKEKREDENEMLGEEGSERREENKSRRMEQG